LEIKYDYAEAHYNLGVVLNSMGKSNDAVISFHRALGIKPDLAKAHVNLGNALRDLGQFDNAVTSYRRALEVKPDYAEAHYNLSISLKERGQYHDAIASCRLALEIKPDFAETHSNLGNVLQEIGQLGEAATSYRRALEIKPDYAEAHSNLLFILSHDTDRDPPSLFAEYRRFAEQFEVPLRAAWPQHDNPRDPERRLQVGFVSGDLRNHAVACFIEPILAHLTGANMALHAYYNHGTEDEVTRRIKGLVTHWHPVIGLSDAELAQRIRADGIDILIDLSGHTAHNRLLAFARKPAPIQVSWIGFPGTTGLHSMDYYLADRFFLPVEQFADQFTEKIVYLPSTTPFLPFAAAPAVNPLPALRNGYVTFGSFNRANKISRAVIAVWAQLLRALPESRMLLGSMAEGGQSENVLTWFAQEGIARERLSLHPRSDMATYLSLHHQVDLCLDTFPYTGGTTTCQALWMGVPTLTLAGKTPFGRDGAGLLGGVGLDTFVAHDAADFVRMGVAWAGQLDALAAIRAQLRERFAQAPIGQPALLADSVERVLRTMWRRWCEGLPAQHF
jgi:protein O-GlcNAc transferase